MNMTTRIRLQQQQLQTGRSRPLTQSGTRTPTSGRTPIAAPKVQGPALGALLRGLLPAVLFFAALCGLGILHVTGRVLVVDAGYRLSRLQGENRELERENHRLKLERATLTNPQRLEELARTRLEMGAPAPSAILSVPAPAAGTVAAAAPVKAERGAP